MQNEILIKYQEPIGEISLVDLTLIKDNIIKKVIFPNVMFELKGGTDIVSILYHHDTLPSDSPLIFSLPFVPDIKRRATYLENLSKRLRPNISMDEIIKKHILVPDPCSEAFWLKRPELRKKFKEIPNVPGGFCDTFDENNTQDYAAWQEAATSGDFATFVDGLIRFVDGFGFDFFVTPVPPIDVSAPSSPSHVNIYNNAAAKILEKSKKKLYILYNLTLNSNVFTKYNNEIIEDIKSYITEIFLNKDKFFHGLYVRIRGIDNLPDKKNYKDVRPLLLEFMAWLGSFSKTFQLPVFLVRSGYYGFYGLEHGIQAFSDTTSGDLGDIKDIRKGETHPKKERLYGKTLIIDDCVELTKKQLDSYIKDKGRLPRLPGIPDKPTDNQNKNPTEFRNHFSKPRRYATRREEIKRLRNSIKKKEIDSIEQYISRCNNKDLKKLIGYDIELALEK